MRLFKSRPPLLSGLDTVGPFHPYLAYAAVILLDLVGLVVIVAILVARPSPTPLPRDHTQTY